MKHNICKRILTLALFMVFITTASFAQSSQWFKAGPYYIDKKELIQVLYRNLEEYMDFNNIKKSQRTDFRNCFGAFVAGIQKDNKIYMDYSKSIHNWIVPEKCKYIAPRVASFISGATDHMIQSYEYKSKGLVKQE